MALLPVDSVQGKETWSCRSRKYTDLRRYYNTVGSKEGWAPSTFVSSRSNRKKDEAKPAQQRPEDFMDEEDIADAEDARRVQTAEGFAGLGSTQEDASRRGAFIDLFRVEGETIGVKLLKKMGWKEGQGVGPKVRRKARLGGVERPGEDADATYLFAPENTHMISFIRKNDHKGLGFDGETKLSSNRTGSDVARSEDEDDDDKGFLAPKISKKKNPVRGGIGIGILNDTGSDDEDPYEIGPRISYNKVIGGDKKKKKLANGAINPLLKSKPVFISKKTAMAKASAGLRKCHDGRLPLDGFILSSKDEFSSVIQSAGKYAPPKIPEGWKSSKQPTPGSQAAYLSTAEAAKASKLDPKSRASILGEAALPGKSVFDFLSSAARDRIAAASGKANLPVALGEIPEGYSMTEEERQKELLAQIPKVDKYTADAALSRGASGFMPYGEDEAKRNRYRAYLENQAGITPNLPERTPGVSRDDWLKELREFANCAQIFKPMSGMMATRFTSSTTAPKLASDAPDSTASSLLSKPAPKPEDPAKQAAKLGMYGPMTRSSQDWYPTRLLCKRFNVKPPAHVQPGATEHDEGPAPRNMAPDLVSKAAIDDMMKESFQYRNDTRETKTSEPVAPAAPVEKPQEIVVDADRNEALEGQRAGEAVFKAIFGDDSDED
jgi:G patch domain-containing protein 1